MYALLVAAIVSSPMLQAPVYVMVSDRVMRRHGTFSCRPDEEGYEVVFCIAQGTVKLRCAVTTPSEMMVIVEAQASEQGS